MTEPGPCPEPQALRAFVLGQLADADVDAVARHLEQCPDCLRRVQEQPADDPLLSLAREEAEAPAAAPPPVQELMVRLKRLSSDSGTRTSDTPAEPGPMPEFLAGRYRLLRQLGAGGMGTVYQAEDIHLGRTVAIKVPRFPTAPESRARARARFLREVHTAARVRHPHVCTVHDVGEDAGQAFVIMEYIAGQSLADELERNGPFKDLRAAARLAVQVAHALQAVHAEGIIHRDLKPSNILINPAGQAVLTDFGLALPDNPTEPLTIEGYAVGTPAYMSPEQLRAQGPIDARSDLFSLGLVLYEMVTGRLPFQGAPHEQVWQRLSSELPPPSTVRPDLDPGLEAIIRKALAPRPEDRYPSADAMAAALEAWLGRPTPRPTRRPLRPAARRLLVPALLALAAVGVVGVALSRRDPRPSEKPAAQERPPLPQPPGVPVDRPLRGYNLPYVNRAVYSPSDPWVIVSSPQDAILLIDPRTGTPVHRLTGHGPCQLWALAVSGDGYSLLSGGDDAQIVLWDLKERTVRKRFKGHEQAIRRVGFTDDPGRIVSASDDGSVRTWDTDTAAEVGRFAFANEGTTINATAFSPDGHWFLNGRKDGSLELYETAGGKLARRWKAHDGQVSAVAFAPDGKQILSGGEDRRLRVWDRERAALLADLTGHDQPPLLATFAPGRRLALSAEQSGRIYVWDLDGGRLARRWLGHQRPITALRVAPAGDEAMSLSGHGELLFWRMPPKDAASAPP